MVTTPIMTSNTTPAPYVMSAASEYNATYAAWKAIDNDSNTRWTTIDSTLPTWIKIDMGSTTGVTLLELCAGLAGGGYAPTSFSFDGSSDDVNWTALSVQSGLTWTDSEVKSFPVSYAAYRYYRIYITANGSSPNTILWNFKMQSEGGNVFFRSFP